MKKYITILLVVAFSSCETSSIEQLNAIDKPAVVFAKHKSQVWYEGPAMSIKDAKGKVVELTQDDHLRALIDKYNVGDTIR